MSMSISGYRNIVDPNKKGSLGSKIPGGKWLFNNTELSHRLLDGEKPPKAPGVPTIDAARQERQETDRIRRRRGALANIAAGESSAPTVGSRVLLGA
jgi:hypothetical protein